MVLDSSWASSWLVCHLATLEHRCRLLDYCQEGVETNSSFEKSAMCCYVSAALRHSLRMGSLPCCQTKKAQAQSCFCVISRQWKSVWRALVTVHFYEWVILQSCCPKTRMMSSVLLCLKIILGFCVADLIEGQAASTDLGSIARSQDASLLL